MSPIVVAAVLLAVAVPALAAERTVRVGAFDRLAVGGSADVSVVTGRAPGVRLTGAAADLDQLAVRVDGGVLRIEPKDKRFWSMWKDRGPVRISITVPMLRGVEAAGSGNVAIDRVRVRSFAGELAGSGALRIAALDADTVKLSSAGSGIIEAAGRCGAGVAEIAGSGGIKVAGLRCETLSASIAGSGRIDAYATRTAKLSTAGSGDINLRGGARCTVSSAGSGKARCV